MAQRIFMLLLLAFWLSGFYPSICGGDCVSIAPDSVVTSVPDSDEEWTDQACLVDPACVAIASAVTAVRFHRRIDALPRLRPMPPATPPPIRSSLADAFLVAFSTGR